MSLIKPLFMKKILLVLIIAIFTPQIAFATPSEEFVANNEAIEVPTTTIATEEIHDLISGTELKTKSVSEIAEIYEIDASQYAQELSNYYGVTINQTDSSQLIHDNYGVEPSVSKDIANSIKTGQEIASNDSHNDRGEKLYDLLPISLVLIVMYLFSHILSKKKIISIAKHRLFWNMLLLLAFLGSGILGILLVIKINLGIAITLPFNIVFWHVEIGIAMVVISIFHILWHLSYFKTLFKI